MSFANHTSNALTELYAGTDFSSLSWLEQQWVAYYAYIGNPVIATGLMSFLIHEVCLRPFTIYFVCEYQGCATGRCSLVLWVTSSLESTLTIPLVT